MDCFKVKWILFVLLLLPTHSNPNPLRPLVYRALSGQVSTVDDTPSIIYRNYLRQNNKTFNIYKPYNAQDFTSRPYFNSENSFIRQVNREIYSASNINQPANMAMVSRAKENAQPYKLTTSDSRRFEVEWSALSKKFHKEELYELCKKVDDKNKGVAHLREYAELRKKIFEGNSSEEIISELLEHSVNKYLISGLLTKSFELQLEKDLNGVKGFKINLVSLCGYKVDYTTDESQFTLSGNWIKASISI